MTRRAKSKNVIGRLLQPWWRLTRGLTLGAQGVVINTASEVLLVRHGYRPGWHFPGGGVERGETLEIALSRELHEEAGILLDQAAELHGMFANNASFPGDHIAVFIVRHWTQREIPKPNAEIAEQAFFASGDLPTATDAGTRRRIDEIFNARKISADW